jgi:hypothetical protein
VKKKKLIFEKSAVISRRTKQQQQQQQNKTIMTEQQQQQQQNIDEGIEDEGFNCFRCETIVSDEAGNNSGFYIPEICDILCDDCIREEHTNHLKLFENKTDRELVFYDYITGKIMLNEFIETFINRLKYGDYEFQLFINKDKKEEIHFDYPGYCYCSRCEDIEKELERRELNK